MGHDRVTVVTVPPSGSEPSELLVRLGQAAGLDLSGPDPNPAWNNASLGAVETEALRRLNAVVGDDARDPAWSLLVKRGLAREGFDVPSQPLRLTADDMSWLSRRSTGWSPRWPTAAGGWWATWPTSTPEPTRLASRPLDEVDESAVSAALVQVAAALGRRLLTTQDRASGRRNRGRA